MSTCCQDMTCQKCLERKAEFAASAAQYLKDQGRLPDGKLSIRTRIARERRKKDAKLAKRGRMVL